MNDPACCICPLLPFFLMILFLKYCRVKTENEVYAEYGVRYTLCLVTFALAAAIPKLNLFISLVSTEPLAILIVHIISYHLSYLSIN